MCLRLDADLRQFMLELGQEDKDVIEYIMSIREAADHVKFSGQY